jgi:catecholate siderophore receptor
MQVLPWLKLVGGGRYDIFSATVGNSINNLNTAGNTTTAYMQQTVYYLSWRAGVIAQPTQEQTYYFSASTSFNPSLEQLTSTTGTTNPLPPENNQSFEAGAKYDLLNQNLSLTGALFQITKNNARTQNTDGTFDATGTIQVKGVRTGIAGRINPEWQVWGGYTYLDARITQGIAANTQGMVPLNTPRDSATLWTTYTFYNKWEIGGGPTYVGQRYANNQNSVQVPEFVRFDATAAYKSEKYDVRLNVFNVFDTQYYEQVIASDGGRAVPGSGLTAMLTLTARM